MIVLRIHGDNILECERALFLIADSFSASARWIASPPYLPRYEIVRGRRVVFTVELFSGHGRWGVSLPEVLQSHDAPLREAVDAIVTRLLPDEKQEEIVLAFEFCHALPAGNNAWQRNGRALACAAVGVPYLYFADIGGVELGESRRVKAPRFPNPIIPFSYLTAGKAFNVVCLPVYLPSPSSSQAIRARFAPVFGLEDGQRLVRCILENASLGDPQERLIRKALTITEMLAAQRKSIDTLREEQWPELLNLETVECKADWLERNYMPWSRKGTGKVRVSPTFPSLVELLQKISLSVGAKDVPLCLVPHSARSDLAKSLLALYGDAIAPDFAEWAAESNTPLIVVWITGFKPRGDDSRPDRGLAPLARMLFGDEADILSIVYGPAKPATWKLLQESPQQLARQNGLWEAIINLSDAVLIDSDTADAPLALLLSRRPRRFQGRICFSQASSIPAFSEYDVDSVLHLLFARREQIFEAMCNPPGGDWSGLSVLDFRTGEEYRWTSLPRVSGAGGKRPDHVIQFLLEDGCTTLLAIESKNKPSSLEHKVGRRLKTYMRQLVKTPPTISRTASTEWESRQGRAVPRFDFSFVSGGAFCWTGEKELDSSFVQGQLDIAFAIEFKSIEQLALLHIQAGRAARPLLSKVDDLARQFSGRLEIQIH